MKPRICISKLVFNDSTELLLEDSDIVIFTGANNAGKSQVLRDIHSKASLTINQIVVKDMEFRKTGDIIEVADNFKDESGNYKYRVSNHVYYTEEELNKSWNSTESLFLRHFVNLLNTEGRLVASKNGNSFDPIHSLPQNPAQAIYADDSLEMKVSEMFHEAFGCNLIVNHTGSKIVLHVGEKPLMDEGEDRASVSYLKKLSNLPELEKQGDGMRSFAGVLMTVFTTFKTIILIDEPEAFLHPPQARLLGKMLVRNKQEGSQLLISTHSEDFLKGVLDTDSDNVRIVRINRDNEVNHMNVLNNADLKALWEDPILRYSNILSGLFHSKVVICESDTDCRFYQAVMNAISEKDGEISPDVLFVHCGGKERFKAVIPALTALKVKTVVVADIDILNKEETFKSVCDKLDIDWDSIKGKWKSVFEYVKGQRAQLNAEEVRREIMSVFDAVKTPQLSSDEVETIKAKLKASSAWAKVKEVGKAFFTGQAYNDVDEIMKECCSKGLFIVPVGELECFYKSLASKSNHGTKWVHAVMQKDLANDPELEEARRFVRGIQNY